MHLGDLLSLLGALGLFLYGMKIMSEALMELTGERLRAFLAATTANRFLAMLSGLLITALIQSSSATTLMVVSFVNAGLFSLIQAVGVIMGANIGTTVTAWLISLLGFSIKLSELALPLVGIGFLFSISKRHQRKRFGQFLIGFSLLFIGLGFLKESLPDVGQHPETLAFLSAYSGYGYLSLGLFLLVGTLLTMIVHSSSTVMALTLLMTYQGWISFDMAAAMVLGENIGTTITANTAALVANCQAKRAALAHLLFNLLGVCWMMAVIYPFLHGIEAVMIHFQAGSPFSNPQSVPMALSMFHTGFNLFNTLLLIGFVTPLARLVEWLIPQPEEPELEFHEPKYLTEAALSFPETGLKALRDESMRLLQNTAYLVIAHGMGVHRSDLESERALKEIIESAQEEIPIDIDQLYSSRIKSIYGKLLEFATQLEARHALKTHEIEAVRNILNADRKLVRVVKQIKALSRNIARYQETEHPAIRREYNLLRHRILKITRHIHRLMDPVHAQEYFDKLQQQRVKAEELDVLVTGRIDKLVLSGEIDREMATSLMNDSLEAALIAQMLVDIVNLLHVPLDEKAMELEERIGDCCF